VHIGAGRKEGGGSCVISIFALRYDVFEKRCVKSEKMAAGRGQKIFF
jgi:hypothetical protein